MSLLWPGNANVVLRPLSPDPVPYIRRDPGVRRLGVGGARLSGLSGVSIAFDAELSIYWDRVDALMGCGRERVGPDYEYSWDIAIVLRG